MLSLSKCSCRVFCTSAILWSIPSYYPCCLSCLSLSRISSRVSTFSNCSSSNSASSSLSSNSFESDTLSSLFSCIFFCSWDSDQVSTSQFDLCSFINVSYTLYADSTVLIISSSSNFQMFLFSYSCFYRSDCQGIVCLSSFGSIRESRLMYTGSRVCVVLFLSAGSVLG